MQSKATTVPKYLASLPPDRRQVMETVRKVILKNLPNGYKEGMMYGMIGYFIPHSIYPPGYHVDPKQPLGYAALASQKNHFSLYVLHVYGDPVTQKWFNIEWKKTGKKLDMGKSCIRFKKLEDFPLDLIGKLIARMSVKEYIALYEKVLRDHHKKK